MSPSPKFKVPHSHFQPCPPLPKLEPGDTFLYRPTELIGAIIALKTWTWLSHCEVYIGDGMSLAARIQGVNLYPTRIDRSLRFIRRPWLVRGRGFDANAAYNAASHLFSRRYDISSFEAFFNPWSKNRHSNRVCSTLTAAYLRGGGCLPFNPDLDQDDISPAQLWQTPALITIWQSKA
jgi:hypothetical protein